MALPKHKSDAAKTGYNQESDNLGESGSACCPDETFGLM